MTLPAWLGHGDAPYPGENPYLVGWIALGKEMYCGCYQVWRADLDDMARPLRAALADHKSTQGLSALLLPVVAVTQGPLWSEVAWVGGSIGIGQFGEQTRTKHAPMPVAVARHQHFPLLLIPCIQQVIPT